MFAAGQPRVKPYSAGMTPLDAHDVQRQLAALPGWTARGDRLVREYRFADFVEAFGFMASVALVAERMGHHPEWSNVWNTVRVELTTHDAGGITAADLALAAAMDQLAGARATQ
jgi:4a-hydroxytetrahydrobiopterin dehydratase